MTDDLSARLRGLAKHLGRFQRTAGSQICEEAADRIERLEVELRFEKDQRIDYSPHAERMRRIQVEQERDEARAEAEKLREALEAICEIGKADLYAYDHHAPFHAAVYTAMRALADIEEADDADE